MILTLSIILYYILFKIIIFLLILLSVGFLTLIERKLLGLSQNRLSVNKLSIVGLLQPIIDGLKLLIKQLSINIKGIKSLIFIGPILIFVINLIFWDVIQFEKTDIFHYQILFILCVIRCTIYGGFISRVSSFNKYSFFGGLRMVIQTICTEIRFSLIVYYIMISSIRFEFNYQLMLHNLLLIIIWTLMILIETHRRPFDLGESERELVRGYNIEFSGSLFVLIFLSEYSSLLFFSYFSSFIFINGSFIWFLLFLYFIITIRRVFVRLKIDIVIYIVWIRILPVLIFILIILYYNFYHFIYYYFSYLINIIY